MPNSKESFLSGAWINARIDHVYTRAIDIFEDLIDDLTESGFLPFETVLTPEVVNRMTPKQREQLGLLAPEENLG